MDFNNFDPKERRHHRSPGKSVAFGVLVIIAGLLLLARNAGMLEPSVSRVIFSWEMLLVAIGFLNIFGKHSIWSGLILISIGAFFLLVDFFSLPFTLWHVFWPVLIIFIGLSLIFGTSRIRKRHVYQDTTSSDDYFEDIAIFGGGERKIMSQEFKGGNIVAVFGGSKIDLSHAVLSPGTNVIEIVAAFGGSALMVPADWNVKVEVFNIFGGYVDKRMVQQVDPSKTLIIKGVTIFGGGEIRNF
jgi:predicted membrane protein